MPSFFIDGYTVILIEMSSPSPDKNSLQSVVDSIQKTEANPFGSEPAKGYVPNPNLKSLRTFQGDMQEHIDEKKETVATIALAEQKKKIERNEPTYTEPSTHSSYTGLLAVVGVICLIGGGLIFGGIYFFKTTATEVVKAPIDQTLIPFTQKKEIPLRTLDSQSIASALLQEQSSLSPTANTILYTAFTYNNNPVDTSTLFSTIALGAGDALRRNILETMSGVYSFDTNEIFFIVRPDDFGIVYSGMLDWESAMGQDFSAFFPALRQYLTTNPSVFSDETYKNKDVRVIRDETGNTIFLYGFIDKNTLVITANEKIFEAILNRYLQSKLSR